MSGTNPAVMYEHRPDGIHVLRFSDTRRATADRWRAIMFAALDANPPGVHFRSLYDVQGLWVSPYAMSTAIAISQHAPHGLPTSTAVLVSDSLGVSLIQTLFNQLARHQHRARRVFTSEAEALDWLVKRDRQFSPHDGVAE